MPRQLFRILLGASLALALGTTPVRAGTEEAHANVTPWSGYWWPHFEGRLYGPLGKYEQAVGKTGAVSWEMSHHPKAQAKKWEGYCHAWSAAALMEKEPTAGVNVTLPGGGSLPLTVGDIKGLLTAAHAADLAHVIGKRYNGPGINKKDMAPDVLWKNLNLFIKQKGIPLVIDIDPSAEVWNYPVYYYRIDYTQVPGGNTFNCVLTLYMADDYVPPDFVGTKISKRTYTFTCQMSGGSVVMGTGVWTGASVTDHPDFAWYPYVVRPENPNVDYSAVRRMLHLPAMRPGDLVSNQPTTMDPANPEQPTNTTLPPPPSLVPNRPPPAAVALSPTELLTLFAHRDNKLSGFDLTLVMDHGLKPIYKVNEPFHVTGLSKKAGYFYLFHVAPDGSAELLYPMPGQNNTVPANKQFAVGVPNDPDRVKFACKGPVGLHRLKAFVTTHPLVPVGVDMTTLQIQGQPMQNQALPVSQNTTLQDQMKSLLIEVADERKKPEEVAALTGVQPGKVMPEFAYLEIIYAVQAAEQK